MRFLFIIVALGSLVSAARGQCPPQEVFGLEFGGNQPGDSFGLNTDVDGDLAIVGARAHPFSPQTSNGPGAAFLYQRDPLDAHQWALTRTFLAPGGTAYFGWQVAVGGDIVAIAARVVSPTRYVVYVHERHAGGANAWGQVAMLTDDDYPANNGDQFGYSIDVDGDTIVIGAPTGATLTPDSAYVFRRDAGGPGQWGKVRRLLHPFTPAAVTSYGYALALQSDTLVVGAPREPALPDGAVYVHGRDVGGPENWGLVQTLLPVNPPMTSGWMGASLALDGDQMLVGCPGGAADGKVRAYRRAAGAWTLEKVLLPVWSGAYSFGSSVALADGRALIGCPADSTPQFQQGAVEVFDGSGPAPSAWPAVTKLQASDAVPSSGFGLDVDVSGTTAVVGNWRNFGLVQLGKVYVFDLLTPAAPIAYCTAGTSTSGCVGQLAGVGSASASSTDGFELVAHGIDAGRTTIAYYALGSAAIGPLPGTSSWRCIAAPRQRIASDVSSGTLGACDGAARIDWNAFRSSHPSALGAPFVAGQTIWAQAWWRDPSAGTGGAATHGLTFTLCP